MLRSLALCSLIACGGGGTDDPAPTDSAPPTDTPAQVATVETVTCDGTEVQTVSSVDAFAFSPNNVTIQKDQVVKFISGTAHNVIPGTSPTDPGLKIAAFGATGCLKFTAIGQFNFRCQPHAFMTGTVTVN